MEITSGCPPSLLAFSLNTLTASLANPHCRHRHLSPVTRPPRPCVMSNQPLGWQGILSAHRAPMFGAELYSDYSRGCKLVPNLACTFFKKKKRLSRSF